MNEGNEKTPPLRFFNPWAEVHVTHNKLPHWHQPGATYFFTWRLADAVPAELRARWNADRAAWLRDHPEPWSAEDEQEYHRRFTAQLERWLDAGLGTCLRRQPDSRALIEESLRFFDGQRYVHHVWVIMPNHVHTLTSLHPDWRMDQVLGTWKSYTGLQINRRLGRIGDLWQEDSYNRLIRDARHFSKVGRYIQRNPAKAKLREQEFSAYLNPSSVPLLLSIPD